MPTLKSRRKKATPRKKRYLILRNRAGKVRDAISWMYEKENSDLADMVKATKKVLASEKH